MDFEEQLEKAERLPTPSLVGSSIRSADDSAHNNYIHPEKSKGRKKENPQGHGILNQSIAASLDDLMREGALLGSEEDFEEVLDDSGNVKQDAKYAGEDGHATNKSHLSTLVMKGDNLDESDDVSADKDEKSGKAVDKKSEKGDKNAVSKADNENNASVKKADEKSGSKEQKAGKIEEKLSAPALEKNPGVSFYSQEDYSTPNLSEYQLDHQINDHKDLLTNIQSHDPQRLPNSQSDYVHDDDSYFKRPVSPSKRSNTSAVNRFNDDVTISAGATDGLHTPYFQRDSRSQSRSGASRLDRSRSRSAVAPHLARGDSYKNTNMNEPSAYELPPGLAASEIKSENEEEEVEEDETQDRRSRQSKPTMGESIAAAEASKDKLPTTDPIPMQRDTSLVTTGDYTNFDVDKPEPQVQDSSNLYSMRSASSTNYLRSISRSRSRQPDKDLRASNLYNEKNDADPEELVKGGALINEDPYSTIGGLDTMVEEVLNPVIDNSEPSKNKSNSEEKPADRDVTKKDDTKEVISTDDKDKPNSKTLDSTMKDDKLGGIISKDDAAKPVDNMSSVTEDETKSNANDNQIKKSDKKDDVDVKAIEQIESSLESNDSILDRAQSLTSDDIHGDSSEANTRFADSIINKDRETKTDLKGDKNSLDNAAIDQIEASIDSKDEVVEKAELLTAEDIHGKTGKSENEASISNKKDTTKTDPENSESVNTTGTEKIESSIGSKDSVAESAEALKSKDINVEMKDTKDKIVNEIVTPDKQNKNANAKETDQVKPDQSKDSTVEKVNSKSIITESDESDKSPNVHASLGDAKEVTEIEKEKDSTVEKNEPRVDSARDTKEEVSKKDVDYKAIEQIESDTKSSDMVTEKATSLTADDINADSTSKSKSVIDDTVTEKQEVDKKDVEDKAAEQIESSIDSNDAVTEKAKSLTANDITADSTSKTKPAPNEAVTEKDEETSKKDVEDKAAEQIESSIDSNDAVAEKAKSLTADDITADSTSETKSAPNEAVTEKNEDTSKKDMDGKAAEQIESSVESNDAIAKKAKSLTADDIVADPTSETKPVTDDTVAEKEKSTDDADSSSKVVTSGPDGEKDKETKPSDLKDTEVSKKLEAKKEVPVTPSKDVAAAPAASTTIDDDLSDIDVSPEELRKHLESQPVYIFTSLAGGMQIMTRTNRLTTILTANGIKFEYRDLGTDEEAKKIWRRQASGKTLPGVVRGDDYIGNWQEVDEANEEYRLREILYETL